MDATKLKIFAVGLFAYLVVIPACLAALGAIGYAVVRLKWFLQELYIQWQYIPADWAPLVAGASTVVIVGWVLFSIVAAAYDAA